MVALYNKKGLSVLNVQYDAKNSRTCDYMIHYTSKLDTVLRVMIWLTEVNAFCLPSEVFETKCIVNYNKVIRLWWKVTANDCCACVVSAASTLCTLAWYHFQNYLEQSLTAYI